MKKNCFWKKHRITALFTAAAVGMGLLAGCGTNAGKESGAQASAENTTQPGAETAAVVNETGMPIVNEPITLKVLIETSPLYPISPELWYFKQMEELTGIRWEIECVDNDQWKERKSLIFASQDLPDIIIATPQNFDTGDIITYAGAKQLIPLNDLLDNYAPNYMGLLEKYPESRKLYAPDGNMYGLNGTFAGGNLDTLGARCFLNTAWLDKAGLAMPQTYEEFYEALVAMRDGDLDGNGENDTIPLSGTNNQYSVDPFVAGPLGIPFTSVASRWMTEGDRIVYVPASDIYLEYLKRMKQLFDEQLLDQEYFTQNEEQLRAKGAAMQLGAYSYSAHFVMTGSTDPAVYGQYEVINPLTSEWNEEKVWYGDAVRMPNIFITSANPYPEATIRYFDYAFSDEGSEMFTGPEYGQWEGEGGLKWNEDHTKCEYVTPEGYNGMWDYLCKEIAPLAVEFQGNSQYGDVWGSMQYTPEDTSFKSQMKERIAPYLKQEFPQLFFTIEEREEVALVLDEIKNYTAQMEVKFITGEEPIENHPQFVETLNSMGLERLIELYQGAYDRYLSAG